MAEVMDRDVARLLEVRAVEEFLIAEARLIDDDRLEVWAELFTSDAVYWVPSFRNQQSPVDTVSIFYDDRELMDVRIRKLRHPENYAQHPKSRTQHLIGNVTIEAEPHDPVWWGESGSGDIHVRSALVMVEYRDEEQRVFAADVRHRLRQTADGFAIAWKRVDLANSEMTLPYMSIPF